MKARAGSAAHSIVRPCSARRLWACSVLQRCLETSGDFKGCYQMIRTAV